MKMLLPPDWDSAGEDNTKLCRLFERKACAAGEGCLPYRLFTPVSGGNGPLPLVVYLHGADAAGNDNEIQLSMHDIGTYLARDEMQRNHPCYILAPQYGSMQHWSMPDIRTALWKLISDLTEKDGKIDADRIYIYGYSAGGVGTLRIIKEHPGYFAAAICICGATGTWEIDNLLKTPMWMIHAADDRIVKATYHTTETRELSNLGSHDIYEWYLKQKERNEDVSEMRYTEYPQGWMHEHYGVNPHCSWVAASDKRNNEIWEWMFSKTLKNDLR